MFSFIFAFFALDEKYVNKVLYKNFNHQFPCSLFWYLCHEHDNQCMFIPNNQSSVNHESECVFFLYTFSPFQHDVSLLYFNKDKLFEIFKFRHAQNNYYCNTKCFHLNKYFSFSFFLSFLCTCTTYAVMSKTASYSHFAHAPRMQ